MKLHLITADNMYHPILMLSHYVPSDVDHLCSACRDLAARKIDRFVLHQQPWIRCIDHCLFIWQYFEKDVGVKVPSTGNPFVLLYSEEAWLEVEAKLDAVRVPKENCLNELTMEGEVSVIISPGGRW